MLKAPAATTLQLTIWSIIPEMGGETTTRLCFHCFSILVPTLTLECMPETISYDWLCGAHLRKLRPHKWNWAKSGALSQHEAIR